MKSCVYVWSDRRGEKAYVARSVKDSEPESRVANR
jgi:hypothetical protein